MAERRVLVAEDKSAKARRALVPDAGLAWTWVGWFGAALGLVGLTDLVLLWIPLGIGEVQWEFATVAQTVASLPVVTLGFVGVLGAALALGRRKTAMSLGVLGLAGGVMIVAALGLFLLAAPVALAATEGLARTGIKKAIFKTFVLGVIFLIVYGTAGVMTLRHVKVNSEAV